LGASSRLSDKPLNRADELLSPQRVRQRPPLDGMPIDNQDNLGLVLAAPCVTPGNANNPLGVTVQIPVVTVAAHLGPVCGDHQRLSAGCQLVVCCPENVLALVGGAFGLVVGQ